MTIEKSVLVPLNAEETFALLTEPERLRRWQAVTARLDLRAGGAFRWTVVPGASASGTYVEVDLDGAWSSPSAGRTEVASPRPVRRR